MFAGRDALTRVASDDTVSRLEELSGRSAASLDEADRAELVTIVGTIASRLAPDDEPAPDAATQALWQELCTIADRIYGSGVQPLGRLPFISDRLVDLMVREARLELPDRPGTGERIVGKAGRALASLAVSRKLAQALEEAFASPVEPTGRATYMYDPPGSHVRTHVDSSGYELIFHLILEHDVPGDASTGSALVAHLPLRSKPVRLRLAVGEGAALSGRGTIHSWEKLRGDEHRTLIGIGFARKTV